MFLTIGAVFLLLPVFVWADTPSAPMVYSDEFATDGSWNSVSEGSFYWDLPADVEKVAVELSDEDRQEPQKSHGLISQFEVTESDLRQGLQYLSVQFKNNDGWGEFVSVPLLIDTIPPNPFSIEVIFSTNNEGSPLLVARATDDISGVLEYQISVGKQSPVLVSTDQMQSGFELPFLVPGITNVSVTAVDAASNMYQDSVSVIAIEGMSAEVMQGSWHKLTSIVNMSHFTILFLTSILLIMLLYLRSQRLEYYKKENRLRWEMKTAKSQTEKIFTALRDEIHEQIESINTKSKLTKKDKEMKESLHRALQVSEALIERELSDVEEVITS
ncbi:hypothetical protein CL653_01380 [bacterium]|nr:hypothetical protein [bacterium]|tara:strand:- start:223 stop:1209 length:987 start_codon:yes stop_codon:yes gene_type:complete